MPPERRNRHRKRKSKRPRNPFPFLPEKHPKRQHLIESNKLREGAAKLIMESFGRQDYRAPLATDIGVINWGKFSAGVSKLVSAGHGFTIDLLRNYSAHRITSETAAEAAKNLLSSAKKGDKQALESFGKIVDSAKRFRGVNPARIKFLLAYDKPQLANILRKNQIARASFIRLLENTELLEHSDFNNQLKLFFGEYPELEEVLGL